MFSKQELFLIWGIAVSVGICAGLFTYIIQSA